MTGLRNFFNAIVFGNFFIAICTVSMIFTTLLMNGMKMIFTPFTVFLAFGTYLLYNFHRISFKLNYSGVNSFMSSLALIRLTLVEKIFFIVSILGMIVCLFFIHPSVFPYFVPMAFLAVTYSVPVYKRKDKKIRLLEVFFIKTPVLAAVWGISTTIIPLVEQNISLSSTFVWLQVFSRCMFIFALCIPFEMRDLEIDKKNNVRTLAVIFGRKNTIITGCVVIVLEIISHHFMNPLSFSSMVALDLSSLIALFLILAQGKHRKPLYYKFYVDGTMLTRFFFLYLAIRIR